MTTTIERIAAILDEDTATSRATIADMERRLSNAFREIVELKQAYGVTDADEVDHLNKHIKSVETELARLIEQSANKTREMEATIDDLNRQLDEAHKENARLVMENEVARQMVERRMEAISPAPVVEEQGPWVIQDLDRKVRLEWCGLNGQWERNLSDIVAWKTRDGAAGWVKSAQEDSKKLRWTVITLAEARAIEANRG